MPHNKSKECKGAGVKSVTYQADCGICINCKNLKHMKLVLKLHSKICESCSLKEKLVQTQDSIRRNNYK